MQDYLNKGRQLFIDDFYTSVSLARHFLQNGTHVTGTIRDNRRHFPTKLKAIVLEKGEAAFYEHDGIVILKYRAKKDRANGKPKIVNVLSTSHAPEMGHTNKRDRDGNNLQTYLYNFIQ